MAAASALMLTACTSEDDLLQTGQQKQVTSQVVGFDVYTSSASNVTRAGLTGTMTTNRLQRSEQDGGGFGVYAFLTEDTDGSSTATAYTSTAGQAPNFMFNEKVLWNSTNLGWYYNPLKYWPNETNNDSQADPASMQSDSKTSGVDPVDNDRHLDRLTFFAYAPYVSAGAAPTGITEISNNVGKLGGTGVKDPTIKYVSTDQVGTGADAVNATDVEPDDYVDLLWGVAPAGGLSYTAVNGTTVTVDEGKPLIDMIKPDVNTSMKFLFNHALARFGITVVAAIDQVSPGGELDPNTKITIDNVKITGPFGLTGELNLNNGNNANIANWTKIQDDVIDGSKKAITTLQSIKVNANETKNAIAPHLRWKGPHEFNNYSAQPVIGVTTAKQDLLRPSNKWFNKLASAPAYNPGKKYYTDEGTTEAHATLAVGSKAQIDGKWGFFYTEDAGVYTKQSAADNTPIYPNLPSTAFYFVKVVKTYTIDKDNTETHPSAATQLYTGDYNTNNGSTEEKAPTFVTAGLASTHTFTDAGENGKVYYELEAVQVPYTELPYKYEPASDVLKYYEAERNYLYVVPTNNVAKNCVLPTDATEEKDLRTITVQIEYYITTVDSKVGNGYTQTKNVITKEVILPSLANSKSYNLNLVLGLTSVKIEAEVDDWKVVNGQVDLPQNTAE